MKSQTEHLQKHLFASLAIVLVLFGVESRAASLNIGASTLNGNAVMDYSTDGLLSFDADFFNGQTMNLVVLLDNNDFSVIPGTQLLDWNGFYNNLTGLSWSGFMLEITGVPTIATEGSVIPDFASVDSIVTSAQNSEIHFDAIGEPSGFELGALNIGSQDWQLDITSLNPGDSFNVNIQAVPVPAAAWLFGSALVLLGWVRKGATRR